MTEEDVAAFFGALLKSTRESDNAAVDAWQRLENAGLIRRVLVHEYRCRKGCGLAQVIRWGENVLLKTRDHKIRPHTNERISVPEARRSKTLNGSNWWPGQVMRVDHLAGRQPGEPYAGDEFLVELNCRHGRRSVTAISALEVAAGVEPGRPGAPTIL